MPLSLKRFLSAALVSAISSLSWAGTLSSVSVTPISNTAGATTDYTFTYTLDSDVNADEALFYVTFPDEFTVATGACDRIESFTLNPSPGAVICRASYGSGNTVGFAVNTSLGGGLPVPGGTVVTVVVKDVTNPSIAGNYYFDPAMGISFSTGLYTTQTMDPMFPMVMEKDTAPQQMVIIGSASVVNGGCGTSNNQTFSATPAAALCATGTASSVTANATTYTWACNGTGGGTNDSCSANKGYDLILSVSPMSGGSVSCTSNPVVHGGNTTCTPTASPGYSFVNWTGDCSGATCVLNNVTSALNPQANFALNTYNIATTVNPSTAGTISCTNNPVNHGDNSTCTYTANSGYTFDNWSGDCTGATCDLNGVTSAKSVTANFTAPSFAITASVSPSGSGTASCTPNPVTGGSNSTCTAAANSGYTFTGWTGDCTGSTCVLGFVSAAKSVTANFVMQSYNVSSSAQPSAGGSVNCPGSISSGGNGTCTATANAGYAFSGWSGCSSSSGTTCTLSNVTSNQSVTASFTANAYTVTANVSPANTGSASCTSPVSYGMSSTCTATAASGYKFTGWSGACSGSTCTLASVTANSTVTASFAVLPTYNVTTQVSPENSGKITCTKDIFEGSTATCTAKASAGFRIKAWSGDCSGSSETCSIANVTSAKSVSATFEQASTFTITASLQSLTGYSTTLNPKSSTGGIFGTSINCSQANPVTINSTVSCSVDEGSDLMDIGQFKGWSGGCSRVEGRNCIIENITTDKNITALYGRNESSTFGISIQPAGAGSLWCGSTLAVVGLSADYVSKNCTAEANPGYTFTSFTNAGTGSFAVNVNFTKTTDPTEVVCNSCNTSTLTTDDSTTKSVSKTGTADALGNTTQSTVSTTTNTETGLSSTNVVVNSQNTLTGATTASNQVLVSVPDSTVKVGDNGTTNIVVDSGSNQPVILNVSSNDISGVIGTSSSSSNVTLNASSDLGIQTEIYNFEFTNNGNNEVDFTKPVSIKLPVPDNTDLDTDLLTLAKIINDKLEYYGGVYNAEGKYFESQRKSFKPSQKSASDEYAYISTSWSEGVSSDLVMRGTHENTLIQNTATLDSNSAVSIQTVTTIATGNVKTTLSLGGVDKTNAINGNLSAGFASINVTGALGTYIITDKQAPENDPRKVSLAMDNGTLTSVDVSDGSNTQTLYTAAPGDAAAPTLTSVDASDEAFSVTLSYPAKK